MCNPADRTDGNRKQRGSRRSSESCWPTRGVPTERWDSLDESFRGHLQAVLNSHGYGLHYAVIRRLSDLAQKKPAFPWRVVAVELPVEVRREHTRIDIVLKHSRRPVYLICECKRVNPALSEWCFLRGPHPTPPESADYVLTELVAFDGVRSFSTGVNRLGTSDRIHHLAVEVKTDRPGDPHGHGRGGIEGAATQVLRSVNGFVEFLALNRSVLRANEPTSILPVIFTTAAVYSTDADLGAAGLQDGTTDLADASIEEQPWLYYQYHQTPGIKHELSIPSGEADVAEILQAEYIRTVAIVEARGINYFLSEGIGFLV